MKAQSASERQCAANIAAVLRTYPVNVLTAWLDNPMTEAVCLTDVIRLIHTASDRCYYIDYCPWRKPPEVVIPGGTQSSNFGTFYDLLQWGLTPGKFVRWDLVKNHRLPSLVGYDIPTARIGWREDVSRQFGRPSMQIIRHVRPDGIAVYEIDFDEAAPYDVAGGVWHFLKEIVWTDWLKRKRTDPFMIAKRMRKAGIEIIDA